MTATWTPDWLTRRLLLCIAVVGLSAPCETFAQSQVSDSMSYAMQNPMIIGGGLQINGPPNVVVFHHMRDEDLRIGTQQWAVISNANNGASVTFRTLSEFRDGPRSRDARLEISIARSDATANWIVTQGIDQTDYASNDGEAVNTAESSGPGNATFNVNVTFITGDFSTLSSGTYRTTVFGMISAN